MGYQSAVLGYEFGINYEVGKRTVKSIPSDLFNRIRAGDDSPINVVYDGQEYTIPTHQYFDFLGKQHMEKLLTNFRNALPTAQSVMNDIIEESVAIELKKAERTPSAMAEIIQALGDSTIKQLDNGTVTGEFIAFQTALLLRGLGFINDAEQQLTWEEWKAKYLGTTPPPEDPLSVYTSFTYTWFNPVAGHDSSDTTPSLTWYGHNDNLKTIYANQAGGSINTNNRIAAYLDQALKYYPEPFYNPIPL